MNKYDCFSIPHLLVYLNAMNEKSISIKEKKIVYWTELKEALELCNLKNLEKLQDKSIQ